MRGARSSDAHRPTGWERLIGHLMPARFRADWGREVASMVRQEEREARRRGRFALVRYRAATALDLLRAGWLARWRTSSPWWHDLRFGFRSIRRSPGFAAAAVLTLGLGTSVSAGMFSAIEQVLIRPLPVDRPADLLHVRLTLPPDPETYGVSPADLLALEARADALDAVTYHIPARLDLDVVLRGPDGPERLNALRAAPDFFDVLGVRPAIGPGFDTSDASGPEVVLSDGAWKRRHQADPGAIGRTLDIDGRPHTIVGVLPASFDLPFEGRVPDYWIARRILPNEREYSGGFYFDAIGRIAPGAPVSAAIEQIESVGLQVARDDPGGHPERRLGAVPLEATFSGEWRRPLALLGGAAVLVLAMACGSVALLLLARQTTRERELGVLMALGASTWSLGRRVLFEVAVVTLAGLGLGLAIAAAGSRLLVTSLPSPLPRFDGVTFDPALWAFSASIAAAVTMLAGLAPLLRLRRLDPAMGLRGSGRTTADRGTSRTRAIVVAAECGLMAMLLVAVGLAGASFTRLLAVDPGFESESRIVIELSAPQAATFPPPEGHFARQVRFFDELRSRLLALPGITGAGVISNLPLTTGWGGALWIEGEPPSDGEQAPMLDWEVAGPGYFETAGIPVLRGRGFEPGDIQGAPNVVVISQTLAERFFPDRDPMGLSISGESREGPWRRVVGIVADVRQAGLDEPWRPHMYIALGQSFPFDKYQMLVATESDAALDAATLRSIVRDVDADGVVGAIRPLETFVDASLAGRRMATMLIALFAGLAVTLAVTGAWGVVSLVGRSRRHEWAIRGALGAGRSQIVAAAARAGAMPVAVGIGAGFLLAVVGARWLAGQMYGLSSWEPGVLGVTLLVIVALVTPVVLLPARRAARVDPASVFRES